MRDLAFFEKRTDYLDYLYHDVFTEPWVWDPQTNFYGNLIRYVADTRSPIFYTISDPSEHFAFSGAYHFETRRERYPNKARECLFWLHDFTHLLFEYPHDLFTVSEQEFINTFVRQERIASTETEVFAYYRVPGLRELVFPDEKLYYDVIRERGFYGQDYRRQDATKKPRALYFLHHRNELVSNDEYGLAELGDHPDILRWFQSWRRLTPKFCTARYRSMAGVRVPTRPIERLTIHSYEQVVRNYEGLDTQAAQDDYERNVLHNLQMAYAILGWEDPPQRWRHCPDAVASLEGAVFFHG